MESHPLPGLLQVAPQDLPDLFLAALGDLGQSAVRVGLLGLDVPGKTRETT